MAMTVVEVEAATGVTADAIRWYVRKGILKPRRNARNGYYEFGAAELRELHFISRAKRLGFSLAEIREILAMSRRRESPCPTVRDIVKRRVVDIAERLEDLKTMDRQMRRALRIWKRMPDGAPRGGEVCRLIEAFGDELDLRAARKFRMPVST